MKAWMKLTLALLIFTAAVTGAAMFSSTKFDEARSARIAAEDSDTIAVESIYDDRIEGQYDPDYDRTRYQQIAKSFATDPVFIDEYQALNVADSDLKTIRAEVDGLDVPIYVAIVSRTDLDASDGEADLIAARIAAELPDERATVLVVDGIVDAVGDKGVVRRVEEPPVFVPDTALSRVALNNVRALRSAEIEEPTEYSSRLIDSDGNPIVVAEDRSDDPSALAYPTGGVVAGIALGIIVGGGLGVSGVMTWRYIEKKRRGL